MLTQLLRVFLFFWTIMPVLAQGPVAVRVTASGIAIPGAVVTVLVGPAQVSRLSDAKGLALFADVPSGVVAVETTIFGFDADKRLVAAERRNAEIAVALTLRREERTVPRQSNGNLPLIQPMTSATPTLPPSAEPDTTPETFIVQGSVSKALEQPAKFKVGDPTLEMVAGILASRPAPPVPLAKTPPMAATTPAPAPPKPPVANGPPAPPPSPLVGMPPGRNGNPPDPLEVEQWISSLAKDDRDRVERFVRDRLTRVRAAESTMGNRFTRNKEPIRGTLTYSYQASAMDAAPFSIAGAYLQKPQYKQQNVSISTGGPLRIPNIFQTDKIQFYFTYTANRGQTPVTVFDTVPTLLERQGNFSTSRTNIPVTVFDTTVNKPFPNNTIPVSRLHPVTGALLDYIPLPNLFGATRQNYQFVNSAPVDSDAFSFRFNPTLSRRDRLAAGVSWSRRDSLNYQRYGHADSVLSDAFSGDLTYTRNYSPRVVHTARATYSRSGYFITPYFAFSKDVSGELGIKGNSRNPVNFGPPNFSFTNFASFADGAHYRRNIHTWTFADSWIVTRKKHSVSLGISYQRQQWNTIAESNPRGSLSFNGFATANYSASGGVIPNTGYDFADFLLGSPQSASIRFDGADTYLRSGFWAPFFQDEWRIRPNLTMNLGLRYEFYSPFVEKYDRMANLDIQSGFTGVSVVTPKVAGQYSGVYPRGLINPDYKNWSPRAAISWRPWPKKATTVRLGYSIPDDMSVYQRIPARLTSQPPFATTSSFSSSIKNPLSIYNPWAGTNSAVIRNSYAVDRNLVAPYAQTWTFSTQQDFGPYALELGYLGTKGTRLVMQRYPNRAAPGAILTAEDRRRMGNATGFVYDSTEGNSIFHAATLRFTRRLLKGMTWNAFYQFGKTIDNATAIGGSGGTLVQDDQNFAAERGLSMFDVRHQVTFSTILNSPWGKTGVFLKDGGRVARILQDWSLSLNGTGRTGMPLTARVMGTAADTAGTGAAGTSRAQATGQSILQGDGFFNPNAFTIPVSGTYGNAGRNTIPGPGAFTVSGSFGRTIRLDDAGRRSVDVRFNAVNIFNHVNITALNTTVNALNYGLAISAAPMRTVSLMIRARF